MAETTSPDGYFPFHWNEYTVNAENMTFRMLIDTSRHGYIPQQESEQIIFSLNQLHTHTYAEMFICTAGTIFLNTEHGTIGMTAGDAVIIPAETKHVKCADNEDAEWFTISFTCIRRHVRGCQNLFSFYHRLCTADHPLIIRGHMEFCQKALRLTESAAEKLPAMTALALMQLLSDFTNRYNADLPAPKLHTMKDEAALNRSALLQYIIASQFMNDLTAQSTARQLFISTRQLERIMKKRYGMSFRQTVTDLRLITAAKMLTESNLSAEKIGRTVGFSSKAGFYREFVKKYGIPPIQYRKQKILDPS